MTERRAPASSLQSFGGPGSLHRHLEEVERGEDLRRVLARLGTYLRPYLPELMGIAVLVAVTAGLNLLNPYLTSIAIDRCIIPGHMRKLAGVVGLMVVVYILSSAGMWIQSVAMIRLSQATVRDLRLDLFSRLQVLPLRFFDRHPHGELMSRLTNDTELVNAALGQSVIQLLTAALSVVGSAGAMLALNWRLTIVTLIILPLAYATTHYIALAARRSYRERQEALGKLNGQIEETITGQRVVIAYRGQQAAMASFAQANESLRRTGTLATIISGLMGPSMNMVRNFSFALLAAAGGWFVLKSWTTLGVVAAFLNYAQQFIRPLNMIAATWGAVQSALAGAERVFAIMDETPEPPDKPHAFALSTLRGEVIFDHVTFGYEPGILVLKEISFIAHPGQTIALVGPTGAGKTTIISLLMRFYDVDSGSIRIDGRDIRDLRRDDLRRALGIVLQDTFLFAGTIRENIRYGRLEATDAEVEEAARLANADGFIRRLPHGYETQQSEAASNLSQGQRQLLAIARAILANPAILILDEATSNVDSRTEVHIQEAMRRLLEGRTAFIIAHRLSTIRRADCILVIEGGRIVERGTHEELLAAKGIYWNLHAKQFGEVGPAADRMPILSPALARVC